MHWTMDVSVRFVSSGIYSLVLPALIVGIVRNDRAPCGRTRRLYRRLDSHRHRVLLGGVFV